MADDLKRPTTDFFYEARPQEKRFHTTSHGGLSGGFCSLNEGFSNISLNTSSCCSLEREDDAGTLSDSLQYSPCSSSSSSSRSPGSSAATAPEKTRQRMSLAGYTGEEKYFRVREQNNKASRDYRNRKKSKHVNKEEQLTHLLKQNQITRLHMAQLMSKKEECIKIKQILDSFGVTTNQLPST